MDQLEIRQKRFGKIESATMNTRVPCTEARMAMEMIVKWGLVAGENGGEDSAGRHKLRLATPEELVERAVKVAEIACQAFEGKNWFLHLVPPEEETE